MSDPISPKSLPHTEESSSPEGSLVSRCECLKGEQNLIVHEETCFLYSKEETAFSHEPKACGDCLLPNDTCRCNNVEGDVFEAWRNKRDVSTMPAVLEATHPLMQRFQQTLRRFLEKENAIAEEQILNLREELRLKKQTYENELETIYKSDHDTNAQRALIEEYEATLIKTSAERQEAEKKAREANERCKRVKEKLEQDIINEREATEEIEALTNLCRQLEQWREETESDLTVSQRMSDKMKAEKKAMADEKRQLDMIIYGLTNEVWKLESKLEMFKKQIEIKNVEMEQVNDKVTAYAAELEDLELDKRRLVSLWNSVLVNIQQRDRAYDSVREDYRILQDNYRTLVNNIDVTKKVLMEEMNKGKELTMNKEKLTYDINALNKNYEKEDAKRAAIESEIMQNTESIEMMERDQNLIQSENRAMLKNLKSTEKELEHKNGLKLKLENDILTNLQECLLNDKAVESMAKGIKKMREMSRKQELSLVTMENQHAKIMLDIEVHRNRQAHNNIILKETLEKVREKEKELDEMQEKYEHKSLLTTRSQRDLDIMMKKYATMKEIFDMKSPQDRRLESLEQQIKCLRERTESLQHEWLRLQGHVVKLTAQHHKIIADINLINKQIQICEQKKMRCEAECENILQERSKVERTLRDLRGQLEILERTRKEAVDRNDTSQKSNLAITYEYAANLKDAEGEIIKLEEEIEAMDKEKMDLTQELDRFQREALIWQRKGILAVELKRNMKEAKSAVGEIGQMRNEIHRMEVRREQLKRTGEKLSEDLALWVKRRETALDKARATAALEKAHGPTGQTSQSTYRHKLRLAKSDITRVNKDLTEAKAHMEYLKKEQQRLETEIIEKKAENAQLEEHIAALLQECRKADKQKQWLLERVVRSQRLGKELATAVKRQSVKVKKPKATLLSEYNQSRELNDRLRHIVDILTEEFPHLSEKLEIVLNTLNIHTPSNSPRVFEDGGSCCGNVDGDDLQNIAEKPFSP